MTNAQYNCFLAVVETGSFSDAARQLFVAQPAISKQIRAMEEEISVKLFTRNGHSIALTKEGALFHRMVLENKRNYDETVAQIQRMSRSGSHLQLNIGCPLFWDMEKSYRPIENWQKKNYPWYELELAAYTQQEILSKVADGTLDFAIHTEDAETQEGLITEPFNMTNTLLMFSSKSPLAKNPMLLKGSGNYTLVTTFNLEAPMYDELRQSIIDATGVNRLTFEDAGDISSIYALLEDTQKMFMASEYSLWKNDPALRTITLTVPRKVFLTRRVGEDRPDVLFLVDHLIRDFRDTRGL